MTATSILLIGFALGLRHATDADHVVVVTSLLDRQPSALRAARIAAWWGVGHSCAFFAIGFATVLLGLHVPPGFERLAEIVVAAMLVAFGIWHLARALGASSRERSREREARPASALRPTLVGVVHGLAGSAGIALLASTTISSRIVATSYLLLFALGTILGMVLLTIALSWPLSWAMAHEKARRVTMIGAACLSLSLGALVVLGAGP
jgi:high-affinity nickel permease